MKSLLSVLILVAVAVQASAAELLPVPDYLQSISVTIKAGNSQGSGTLVTRKLDGKTVTFVWTAAHVVDGLRTTRKAIGPDGATKTIIEYRDAQIVQERQQSGRRVGEVQYDCKVLRVSGIDYGEDLALLMVRCRDAYPLSISAKFHGDRNYVPPIGAKLSHCGSLLGQFGSNSYTTGVLSQTGRLLDARGTNVQVFDQVTAVAFPGSSGGGMFLQDTGEYVGMLTRGVSSLQGFNFIVPVRRIYAWTKRSKIEWALDPAAPMPPMSEILEISVEDFGSTGGGLSVRGVLDEIDALPAIAEVEK